MYTVDGACGLPSTTATNHARSEKSTSRHTHTRFLCRLVSPRAGTILSLSCTLSTLSLLLRLLLLKQTNRRISTDDVLLQAASFNGRSMAFARDPSLSTVHTSNYEIILVDVHATYKQLQTVQHACMRASLFSLANSANIRMCFIELEIWNGRKAYSMATSLTRGAVFSVHSWGACPQRGIAHKSVAS